MLRSLLAFMAVLTTLGALSQPAAAQRMDDNWEELGCVDVGFRPDQDIIEVGRREGTYKAIRLRAFNADIGIDDLRVVYGNGQPDNLRVRAVLRDREMTRPLDLEGRERFINRIEISTQKASRGRGKLCAYGLQNNDRRAGPRGPGANREPGPLQMGWEELGCVDVGRRPDMDSIDVGRREGTFKAIRLGAFGNDIEIRDLKVIYGNGQPDDIRVRSVLREGDSTRPLDLEGRERFIKRIDVVTNRSFRGRGRGPARLCAYGLKNNDRRADPRGPGANRGPGPMQMGWEELGCVDVGRRPDMDSIDVGRREGTFKAIRLGAFGNDIEIRDLKVVYGNGQPDDIRVRSVLREGDSTRPLDLEGRERFIKRIDVVTNRSFRGRGRGPARLCAYGLQNDRRPDMGPGPRPGDRGLDRRGDRDSGWEQLGCKKVSFVADHDTIQVGRREGRFRAIRLEVEDVSVEVLRVRVNYANGEPDVIPFRGKVTKGTMSPPLDLKGNRRSISSIDLFQFAKLNVGKLNFLKGGARVCVSGLK